MKIAIVIIDGNGIVGQIPVVDSVGFNIVFGGPLFGFLEILLKLTETDNLP